MSGGNEREFIDHLQNKEKGGKAMKCPLFHACELAHDPEYNPSEDNCLQEDCAWWDKLSDGCAILAAFGELVTLNGYLRGIWNKMPHEGRGQ